MARASLLLIIAVFSMVHCYPARMPQTVETPGGDDIVFTPKKRPFCNAFTGCGRKRSQGPPGMPVQELMRQRQYTQEDTFGPILESESTIDEISRQILSEAKLWETLQEASAEIAKRKQKEIIYNNQ